MTVAGAASAWRRKRVDIAQGVDTALDGIVAGVDGLAARRLSRMRLDQQAAGIEADQLRIGAGGDALADVRMRNRIERLADRRPADRGRLWARSTAGCHTAWSAPAAGPAAPRPRKCSSGRRCVRLCRRRP